MNPVAAKARTLTRAPGALLQRKCDCGSSMEHEGECEDCKKKKLQRRATGNGPACAPPLVHEVLRSSGQPLDEQTRSFFEPRFGYDFSKVRIHTDARSQESARAVKALAFTVGNNLVFGSGHFAPATKSGQRLLAHELTHVVQQSQTGNSSIQRKLEVGPANDVLEQEADRLAEKITGENRVTLGWPVAPPSNGSKAKVQRATDSSSDLSAPAATTVPPATGLIVDDEASTVGAGQMRKSEFLEGLRASVCAAADSELAAVGRTAQGCPFIERWIARLHTRTSQYIERGIRKYAPESANASAARDYFTAVSNHVRQGVSRWAKTGDLSDVPPELMSEMGGGGILGAIGGAISSVVGALGSAISGIGNLFTKAKDGGARQTNPAAIQAKLGAGAPLDGGVRTRMETAFGHSFSRVRVHADSRGAELSANVNARAFTIGNDVAFAAGEYRPGTLIGDALIAHELAHVAQQGDGTSAATPLSKGGNQYNSLEEDANISAAGAMVALWTGSKTALKNLGANALPRLRSGLRLQRCGGPKIKPEATNVKWDPGAKCTGLETTIGNVLGLALASVRQARDALDSPKNVADQLMKNFKMPADHPKVAKVKQVLQGALESMEATAQGRSQTESLGTAPVFNCVPCDSEVFGGTTYACDTSQPVPLIIGMCVKDGKLASPNPLRTMIHEFIHASCGRTKEVVGSMEFLNQGTGVTIIGGEGESSYKEPQPEIEKNLRSAYAYAQFVMDVTGQ
jgi:hypothetical protein